MKRREMCKINRNNTETINDVNINPLSVNVIAPDIVGNQNWLHYDVATGVDIIELNDSEISETSSEETPNYNLNHAWSYANNTVKPPKDMQDNYRVNKKARERRRLRNDDRQRLALSSREYVPNDKNIYDNTDVGASDYKSNVRLNHQINCFTIINKHFISSDTSSENIDYDNIDQSRPMGDGLKEHYDYNNVFGEEIPTNNSDCDAEKKTIWIYSFKNKRLLSDNYLEMLNNASNETDSSTSFSFDKYEEDTDNITRAASPIPPPYIPRLNLTLGQTLSTVTEVTEPNKQPSSVERIAKVPVIQKPKNTWFLNNKDNKDCLYKPEKSTNIVNWMALSPRERRRIFRGNDSNVDVNYKGKLDTLQEVCRYTETKMLNSQDNSDKNETYNDIHSQTVDVDIHSMPKSSSTLEAESKIDPITHQSDMKHIELIEHANKVEVLTDDENIQEVIKCSRKPQIKISQKCIINTKTVIDPLEKLNTDNWIVEETEEQTAAYSYDLERIEDGNSNEGDYTLTVNDRLWSKNAQALMKPAQWMEYAPIAESHLSLHLSLDSTKGKQTWLSRLINLFKCCN